MQLSSYKGLHLCTYKHLYYTAFGEQDLLARLEVDGVVLLQECASHVPEGFLGYRNIYIANILQSIVGGDVKPSDIQMYLASMPESTLVGSPPCKLLWEVTTKQDFPHTLFLAPPVTSCLVCSSQLKTHNHPTAVICYTLEGSLPAAKMTLHCTNCHLNYRYDQFDNSDRYQYHRGHIRPFVRATNSSYASRACCELWAAAG